jgi:hypothetical protein
MSNPLSVRRVQFQDLDESGNPTGSPMFGVIASDSYAIRVNNMFDSADELNEAINAIGCILLVADPSLDAFDDADINKIGTDNFYDTDWQIDRTPDPADLTDRQDDPADPAG